MKRRAFLKLCGVLPFLPKLLKAEFDRHEPVDPLAAGVFYVDGDAGDDANDGLSPETSLAKLQTALDRAEPGAMIRVKGPVGCGVVEKSHITMTGMMIGELPHLTIKANDFFAFDLTAVEPRYAGGMERVE